MTPTSRTLNKLRLTGWTCQTVEQWIPRLNIRRDLWGVGDVLAMREGSAVLLVQCTSGTNISARIAKAVSEPRLRTWLASRHPTRWDEPVWQGNSLARGIAGQAG
ncbi:MAG: hypothetical protein IT447_16300 [Phycisphaerales bacterium]|jgi:hypothetical protein|nr:hypothetical protein [Phycisphaerales bacterium]